MAVKLCDYFMKLIKNFDASMCTTKIYVIRQFRKIFGWRFGFLF